MGPVDVTNVGVISDLDSNKLYCSPVLTVYLKSKFQIY